jgi:predicted enzyme related to lactoylglutathione lyase
MIRISNAQVWVHDQEEALAFYTKKLGWEVRSDVTLPEMGDFRWLTVSPPGQEDFAVVLMAIPGPPVFEEETAAMVRDLMARGVASPIFLSTDDVHAAYEDLKARGVEFVDAPEERPYGIDSSFRDPSGNQFRLTQVREFASV